MEKTGMIEALGQSELLRPARVKAALAANDRLKLYLSLLQSAQTHAERPALALIDLSRELAAAGINDSWLIHLPESAYPEGGALRVPELMRLFALMRDDLRTMLKPLREETGGADELDRRTEDWCERLESQPDSLLEPEQLRALTHSGTDGEDSFHRLVMDLHKALNQLATALSSETIDGAHVWDLLDQDRALVAAFMRGVNRTRALKLDHPGLDTAATRDGASVLIQNDIGTNDAHVLVIRVDDLCIGLTYSDLHRSRFLFFQALLSELGAQWSLAESCSTKGLNDDRAYLLGTASFTCRDKSELQDRLEDIGARIVFLIDWNKARKRLLSFVGKSEAVAVLATTARREWGHVPWLAAGGDQLIFDAMQAVGPAHFHVGDRLDQVLGPEQACGFLVETLSQSSQATLQGQPVTLIADEIRLLLARHLQLHRDEFDLLTEHAAYCHALAEGLRDALAHRHENDVSAVQQFAERAQFWEHQADQLVIHSRARAERHPRWGPFAELIQGADDVADELEEAAYLFSLIAGGHHQAWEGAVHQVMHELADVVLTAVQDHVRALAIAKTLDVESKREDQDAFVAALWRVLNAERLCDRLLREARRTLCTYITDAATLSLSTDFAAALEQTTDALLWTGYGLRNLAFSRIGMGT